MDKVQLSARCKQVLILLGEGLTNLEIGDRLGISEKTVKGHVTAVLKALKVTSRTKAAIYYHHQKEEQNGSKDEGQGRSAGPQEPGETQGGL